MLRVRVTTLELKKPCPKHKHGLYQPKLRRKGRKIWEKFQAC
jgi:hypothetical protein